MITCLHLPLLLEQIRTLSDSHSVPIWSSSLSTSNLAKDSSSAWKVPTFSLPIRLSWSFHPQLIGEVLHQVTLNHNRLPLLMGKAITNTIIIREKEPISSLIRILIMEVQFHHLENNRKMHWIMDTNIILIIITKVRRDTIRNIMAK
jgi:hypothetical protein